MIVRKCLGHLVVVLRTPSNAFAEVFAALLCRQFQSRQRHSNSRLSRVWRSHYWCLDRQFQRWSAPRAGRRCSCPGRDRFDTCRAQALLQRNRPARPTSQGRLQTQSSVQPYAEGKTWGSALAGLFLTLRLVQWLKTSASEDPSWCRRRWLHFLQWLR